MTQCAGTSKLDELLCERKRLRCALYLSLMASVMRHSVRLVLCTPGRVVELCEKCLSHGTNPGSLTLVHPLSLNVSVKRALTHCQLQAVLNWARGAYLESPAKSSQHSRTERQIR